MHVAARHGSLQVMRALVEEGADLTWRTKVCGALQYDGCRRNVVLFKIGLVENTYSFIFL